MIIGNIDAIANNLHSAVKEAVDYSTLTKVSEAVRDTMSKEIDIAYEEYTPYGNNKYERREDEAGGFGDPQMLETLYAKDKNGISILCVNNAKGVGDARGEYIDEIIETGEGYTWEHQPPERPVIARTVKSLSKTNLHVKKLKEGLISRGIKIR